VKVVLVIQELPNFKHAHVLNTNNIVFIVIK